MPGDDGLRYCAHADGIRAQCSKGPDFGRGLVAGSSQSQVDALMQGLAEAQGAGLQLAPEGRVINRCHVRETRSGLHVRPNKRVGSEQVDVVSQGHQVAHAEGGIQGPSGIGEQHGPHTEAPVESHGRHNEGHGVALVEMEPAGLENHLPTLECTEDHPAAMPGHGWSGEPRQVGEGDGHARPCLGAVRQGAKSRPKDDGQLRNEGSFSLQDPERIGDSHEDSRAWVNGWA